MPSSSSKCNEVRDIYDTQAAEYNALMSTPFGVLESQLVSNALRGIGICKGAMVLDLGGGTGMRAQQALGLGAAQVDVLDISAEMMATGKRDAERLLGHENATTKLRWFLRDVTRPLYSENEKEARPVAIREQGSYDIVMGNWIFDHVSNIKVLEAIWLNITKALKLGGYFIGVRACDPRTRAMTTGKYGPTCQSFEPFPGGLYYSSIIPARQPVHLDNASLEVSYSGSTELHHKYGFAQVEIEKPEMTDVVQSDPKFWDLWIGEPGSVVVKAKKTSHFPME